MLKNPLSYPGNKNRIVSQIIPLIDIPYENFVDVFCGSGVVGANCTCNNVHFNDSCVETIDILKYFYSIPSERILKDLDKNIEKYKLTNSRKHEKGFYKEFRHEGLSRYNKIGYNKLKEDYNKSKDINLLVLLIIYGFNHYIRFNSKGNFNVPVGKVDLSNSIYRDLKKFIDEIKKKSISFTCLDFTNPILYEDQNAIYYFDPPYLITNAPYNASWNIEEEKKLLALLDKLESKGIKFCLSNVFVSNGKQNIELIEWSKKYNVCYIKRQYRNANYQKINIADSKEVIIKNF